MDLSSRLEQISKQWTPEYFEKLSKSSYENDREYPENFSNWYSCIKDFGKFKASRIISNQIFTWEETEAFKKSGTLSGVKNWKELYTILEPTISKMEPGVLYSIKNGCFSNKFDFNKSIVDKDTLVRQLWKLNYASHTYETGGYTELVVREYLALRPYEYLTIYNGMPLTIEVRVFYNMDTKRIEYIVDYWDYNYCANNVNNPTDRIIFEVFHNRINVPNIHNHTLEFTQIKEKIERDISTLKFEGLTGVWSVDFLYKRETDEIYLIDMARGYRSAYWNPEKLKPETLQKLKGELK